MPVASEVASPLKLGSESAERAPAGSHWTRFIPAIAICAVLVRARVKGIGWPLPPQDFMTYWAAARLFLTGANPYHAGSVFEIERSVGWQYAQPLVPLNPPWALPFIAPLGLVPFQVAHMLWWALAMAAEAFSAVALWRYFGGKRGKEWIALLVAITFLPGAGAERMGQITPLMMAGLTVSLLLLRQRRDLLAGVCLIALGMKPHLLYLVVLAILMWTMQSRRWKVAVGALSVCALSTAAAISFNHQVLAYLQGTTQAAIDTACGVGGALREVFGMQHEWLQFAPTAFGAVWFAFYWHRHRTAWQWEQRIPTLVLVSLATAPYSWSHDYILVLPAFFSLAAELSKTLRDWTVPSACYLVVQMFIFYICAGVSKAWVSAASLVWLVLYYALRRYFVRPDWAHTRSSPDAGGDTQIGSFAAAGD